MLPVSLSTCPTLRLNSYQKSNLSFLLVFLYFHYIFYSAIDDQYNTSRTKGL